MVWGRRWEAMQQQWKPKVNLILKTRGVNDLMGGIYEVLELVRRLDLRNDSRVGCYSLIYDAYLK